MQLPTVVSRDEWRAAREALLVQEKEVTRAEDALAARRRELPAVEVDKEYAFESPAGKATRDGGDNLGISVFLRDGDPVLHTYSTFYRGAEPLLLTYKLLDYTPTGRQKYITQFPHKDRYGK